MKTQDDRGAAMRAARGALLLAAAWCWWAFPATPAAAADSDDANNPHVWKSRTTSVAVFKNGLGFFLREGDVELRDGWCAARQVPPAAFGTLAIYSLTDGELVDVVGCGPGELVEFNGTDAPRDDAAKRARLNACKELNVELTYTYKGDDRKAAGKLLSVGPEFVVLESNISSFAVPVAGIKRLQVLELPLRVHAAAEGKPAGRKTRLGMAYLRKGVTWIPEYTLKVLGEDTCELTLRGTLVNEAEDLIHCDVNFVVGVPHFLHTGYLAPIAVGQVIRTIGTAVVPQAVATQIMNRAMIAQTQLRGTQDDLPPATVERPADDAGGDLAKSTGNLPQMGGAAATDYTVYTKNDLTVRRGEKAIVTLFVRKIRYSHIYRWSPPGQIQHFLLLENSTDTAWTTGPCLAVSAKRPLSEDLLKYTAKGSRGELPVTTAVNIACDKTEREADRKLKAHSPQLHQYLDLVTLAGELRLRNYEKRDVTILIHLEVPGRPTDASDAGATSVDTTRLRLIELAGSIRWTVTLKPGQSKTLSYKYERYVPSN